MIFPKFYTWHPNGEFWKRKVYEGRKQVGRIVSAHLAEGEHNYLHVLLNHVIGATSFEHLKMVDGVVQPSFRDAAEKRGLIEEDNTLDECLTEATMFKCLLHFEDYLQPFWYFANQAMCSDFGRNTWMQC